MSGRPDMSCVDTTWVCVWLGTEREERAVPPLSQPGISCTSHTQLQLTARHLYPHLCCLRRPEWKNFITLCLPQESSHSAAKCTQKARGPCNSCVLYHKT
ncbi:hypothetical protein AOLI_G00088820 [Acnodon oligacanthus]